MNKKSNSSKKKCGGEDSFPHSLAKIERNENNFPNFEDIEKENENSKNPNSQQKENQSPLKNLMGQINPLDENFQNNTLTILQNAEESEAKNESFKVKVYKSKKIPKSTHKNIADSRNKKLLGLKREKTESKKKDKEIKEFNKDDSIKEVFRIFLFIVKILIEALGNIVLRNPNDLIGGIGQNKKILEAKVYQLFCYYEENLTEFKNANPENETLFNYFSTRTLKFLFKKYYNNCHHFRIEGKEYKHIQEFKTLGDILNEKKKKFYKKKNKDLLLRKIENFKDTNLLVLNNFKGHKIRIRHRIIDFSGIKLNKFEKYIETKNDDNEDTRPEEKNKILFNISKPNDGPNNSCNKGDFNFFNSNKDISSIFKQEKTLNQEDKKQEIIKIDENIKPTNTIGIGSTQTSNIEKEEDEIQSIQKNQGSLYWEDDDHFENNKNNFFDLHFNGESENNSDIFSFTDSQINGSKFISSSFGDFLRSKCI